MSTTILLVDDDVELCQMFELTLTNLGFEVDLAHNGIDGLKKAYSLQPDVILLDVMMPDMDGWDTCKRFKEMCDVPVIMLTAVDSQESVIKGLDLGADDYIVKTVTTEELAAHTGGRIVHLPLIPVVGLQRTDGVTINVINPQQQVEVRREVVDISP